MQPETGINGCCWRQTIARSVRITRDSFQSSRPFRTTLGESIVEPYNGIVRQEHPPFPPRRRGKGPAADAREEFAATSTAPGVKAERAFLDARIELLERDPHTRAEEKDRAIAELRAL